MRDKREFSYLVDANDRIVSANGDWYAFALENGAALGREVIGQSLWDFICDAETKILYSLFLKSVRESGAAKHLPYRCDSADVRRYMEMTIAPAGDGSVEFRSRVIREDKRESVELLDFETARTNERIVMCSWCKKVRMESGEWVEVEEAVTTLKLFNATPLPKISHGICERCKSEIAEYSL
jgi:hypothetical protein